MVDGIRLWWGDGSTICRSIIATEEPVFTSERKGADCILDEIVVNIYASAIDIPGEPWKLSVRVGDMGLPILLFGRIVGYVSSIHFSKICMVGYDISRHFALRSSAVSLASAALDVIGNEKYIIFGKMEYIRISNNDASFSVTMVHRFR